MNEEDKTALNEVSELTYFNKTKYNMKNLK